MAGKEEKDKNNNKKKSKSGLAVVLSPIISIILIAACFIAIIQGILDIIVGVVNEIMNFLTNPGQEIVKIWKGASNGASYLFNTGNYQLPESTNLTIILEEEHVKEIQDNIAKQSIDSEKAGLTNDVVKKLILVNYMTMSTSDTEIAVPMSGEEILKVKTDLKEKGENVLLNITEFSDGIFNYWIGNGGEHGKLGNWYMSVYGIVRLTNPEGKQILSYDKETLEQIQKDCKGAYENGKNNYGQEIERIMKSCYTISNIGSIDMKKVKSTSENVSYKYGDKELIKYDTNNSNEFETVNLQYSQYISQYTMTMDFLISLMELTGSSSFINAICELIGEYDIEVVVAPNDIANKNIKTITYLDDVEVQGIQEIQSRIVTKKTDNKGKTTTEDKENVKYQDVKVIAKGEENKISGKNYNVIKDISVSTYDVQYSIFVKSVNTWYCSAEYEMNGKKEVMYTFIDKDGNEVQEEEEYNQENVNENIYDIYDLENKIGEKIDSDRIWVAKDNEKVEKVFANKYENALDSNAVNSLSDKTSDYEEKFTAKILNEVCANKQFFRAENLNKKNNQSNDVKENKNGQENKSDKNQENNKKDVKIEVTENTVYNMSRVTKIIEDKKNINQSEVNVVVQKEFSGNSTTTNYIDNTDVFLGLLKNDTGTYVKGAKFNPSGKKVRFKDLYKGEAVVGDLLVNGSDALFQFMESTTSYNKGLENVMKYILYRYSNEDFGVTNFDDAINWLKNSSFSSIGNNSYEDCLSKMMTSYEGNIKTSDGTKYWILDGYNNDNFHSISTAHGFLFYAESYNGFAHEDAMNKAYKECNMPNMTLEKAIKDLINSNGTIKTQLVSNNAFPEKYALPVEVVDKAHAIRIAEEMQVVKNKLDRYNRNRGKNKELTPEQLCAIVDAGWQYGPSYYDIFMELYMDIEDDIKPLRAAFLPFNDSTYAGRSAARWKLFSEGVYTLSDGSVLIASQSNGGSMGIVDKATKLVDLTKMGGREQVAYGDSRHSSTGYNSKTYVCASFVSEVLFNSSGFRNCSDNVQGLGIGLSKDSNYELVYYNAQDGTHNSVSDFSSSKNLNLNIESDILPGDIVATYSNSYTFQHVVVYIGEGNYAHHGGGSGKWNYPNISSNFFANYTKNNIKYIFRYKGN